MITKLIIQGFKDQDRFVNLSGLDLFTSDDHNGVGKSAVLEGFKLALLGEVPGKARTVSDIMRFTSREEMSVEVMAETNQGQVTIERRFLDQAVRGEKRPIKIDGSQRKYEEGDEWIRETLGVVSISFDPHEFLSYTDSKKRQWIIENSPESRALSRNVLYFTLLAMVMERYFGHGLIRSLLSSFGLSRLEEFLDVSEEEVLKILYRDLVTLFLEQDRILYSIVSGVLDSCFSVWSPSASSEENISAILARLKEEVLRLKSAEREQGAVVAYLIGSGEEGEADCRIISQHRENIKLISEQLSELKLSINTVREQAEKLRKKGDRIRFLKESIYSLTNQLEKETVSQYWLKIKELKKKITDTRPLQEELDRLNREFNVQSKKFQNLESCFLSGTENLQMKRDKLAGIEFSHCRCPIAEEIRCDTDLEPYRALLTREVDALTRKEADKRRAVLVMKDTMRALEDRIMRKREALNSKTLSNDNAQQQIRDFMERVTVEEKKVSKSEGLLEAYREEISALECDPDNEFTLSDPRSENSETMIIQKQILESQLRDEQDKLSRLLRRQGKEEALSEISRKREISKKELETVKIIYDLLGPDGIQGSLAERIAGSLEREVNNLLKMIDAQYEFVLDLSGRNCELGWNREGKLIPFSTINSAHFILFIVPFLTALLNRMAAIRGNLGLPTLKAVCIEAESLTSGNLLALLKGLSDIKEAGFLDNVLVAHYKSVHDPNSLYGFREHVLHEMDLAAAEVA